MREAYLWEQCKRYTDARIANGDAIWYVKEHGCLLSSKRGVPDVLLCCNGRFVAVELKVGDNEPTAEQSEQHRQIAAAGGIVGVAYTRDQYTELVQKAWD